MNRAVGSLRLQWKLQTSVNCQAHERLPLLNDLGAGVAKWLTFGLLGSFREEPSLSLPHLPRPLILGCGFSVQSFRQNKN